LKSQRSDRLRLQDILDAMAEIDRYFPMERAAFDANPLLQSHIFRHVMIVGEAAFRLSKELKASNPQIPWIEIEGMRHILVHDYFKVDWEIVYTTAHSDIPKLKPRIEAALASLPPDEHPA
jgi:uncharacterized protein with HEPN domain